MSGWHCQVDGLRCSVSPWGWDHLAFVDATLSSLYKGHRFPVEIISPANLTTPFAQFRGVAYVVRVHASAWHTASTSDRQCP